MRGVVAAAVVVLGVTGAQANPVADFYTGKNVNVLIGYSAGGGYDLYARLLSRHMGKHIPGRPGMVAQNMPGAGSLKVATFLYSVAPKDGTAIGTFGRGMPIFPLLFTPEFDGTKFGYLGSITKDTSVCITWHTSPIKNWNDLMTKPSAFGGEGKGADPDMFATLIRDGFKAKLKLVSGYPGTADMTLAMERGELDGLCGISMSTINAAHSAWLTQKKINVVLQIATEKHRAIPDTPLITDLATSPSQKMVLDVAVAPQTMARPFVSPPDIPAARLNALQEAFDRTMKDPDFLADAERMKLDVNPVTGAEIAEIVKKLYAAPKEVLQQASAYMGAK